MSDPVTAEAIVGGMALGGAALGAVGGYVIASRTTTRQLRHQREEADRSLKRDALQTFNGAALHWADVAQGFVAARLHAPDRYLVEHERYGNAWREMTGAFSLVVLIGSDALVERVGEEFVPARDQLIAAAGDVDRQDAGAVFEASKAVRNAMGELLNDFRRELGEPSLNIIESAAASVRQSDH